MLPTLFNVVNNTEHVVEPESRLQLGVTMLNNIVDNIEQYGQHNIVQSCFHQLVIFCRVLQSFSCVMNLTKTNSSYNFCAGCFGEKIKRVYEIKVINI